jgi:hypothetical protein
MALHGEPNCIDKGSLTQRELAGNKACESVPGKTFIPELYFPRQK